MANIYDANAAQNKITVTITECEHAHILAALRLMAESGIAARHQDIATNCNQWPLLDEGSLWDLGDRWNLRL